MKDTYFNLKTQRKHYVRCAVKGEFDKIPEE